MRRLTRQDDNEPRRDASCLERTHADATHAVRRLPLLGTLGGGNNGNNNNNKAVSCRYSIVRNEKETERDFTVIGVSRAGLTRQRADTGLQTWGLVHMWLSQVELLSQVAPGKSELATELLPARARAAVSPGPMSRGAWEGAHPPRVSSERETRYRRCRR